MAALSCRGHGVSCRHLSNLMHVWVHERAGRQLGADVWAAGRGKIRPGDLRANKAWVMTSQGGNAIMYM